MGRSGFPDPASIQHGGLFDHQSLYAFGRQPETMY